VTPEAERYLDKAQQSLAHARAILAIELGEDAGRAAYLGAFHAAQAFIFERTNRVAKTHRGVHGQFLKLVSDEPRIDLDLRRFLSEGYKLKAIADCETGPDAVVPWNRLRQPSSRPAALSGLSQSCSPNLIGRSYRLESR
jgi:uncharacterized protein (UPF0332 family)